VQLRFWRSGQRSGQQGVGGREQLGSRLAGAVNGAGEGVVRVTREGIADEDEWSGTATVELDCPGRPLCTVRREIEARR